MTDCNNCEYYDAEDDRCLAFECYGLDCPPLPCEVEETDNNKGNGKRK